MNDNQILQKILTVEGFTELTADNNELFRKQVCAALNGHTTLEINLSRTTYMDCAGLGALIALRKFACARNAVMLLVNPTRAVRKLFEVVRAGEMFEIVSTGATNRPQYASQPVFFPASLSALLAAHGQTAPQLEFA